MRDIKILLFPTAMTLLIGGAAIAHAQGVEAEEAAATPTAVAEPEGTLPAAENQRAYQAIRPCIGAGYLPYSYPAIGSCPCGDDLCFNPHRYYCCGKEYKKAWFHKWVGSHLGKRSMLDDYWCPCLYPRVVPRPYLRTVKLAGEQPPLEPPPLPADSEAGGSPAPAAPADASG